MMAGDRRPGRARWRTATGSLLLVLSTVASLIVLSPIAMAATVPAVVGPSETITLSGPVEVQGDVLVQGTLDLGGADVQFTSPGTVVRVEAGGALTVRDHSRLHGSAYRVECAVDGTVTITDSSLEDVTAAQGRAGLQINGTLTVERSTVRATGWGISSSNDGAVLRDATVSTSSGTDPPPRSALSFFDMDSVVLQDCVVSSPTMALEVSGGSTVGVRGCDLSGGAPETVYVQWTPGLHMESCRVAGSGLGIRIANCRMAEVVGCKVEGCPEGGVRVDLSDAMSVTGLDSSGCGWFGLNVSESDGVTVRDCTLSGQSQNATGLYAMRSSGLSLSNVTSNGYGVGVELIYCNRSVAQGIWADSCPLYGIGVSESSPVELGGFSATLAGIDGMFARSSRLSAERGSLDSAGECGVYANQCTLTLRNVSASGCGRHGVRAAENSIILNGCELSRNGLGGLLSLDQGSATVARCVVDANTGDGVEFLNTQNAKVTDSRLSNNTGAGLRAHYYSRGVQVERSRLERNRYGVVMSGTAVDSQGASVTLRDTWIVGSWVTGAWNLDPLIDLDARNCWWGNNTGPRDPSGNPRGSGDAVSGKVLYRPWLKFGDLLPTVSGPTDLVATEGVPLEAHYTASDWDSDESLLRFSLEGAPPNLTITTVTGTLLGVLEDDAVGAHVLWVTATDTEGGVGRLRVNLTVVGVNEPPAFVGSAGPLAAKEREPFATRLVARDVDSDPSQFVWSLVSGPAWLAVTPDGSLEGTPPDGSAGALAVEVSVDDGDGGTARGDVRIVVAPTYDPVRIATGELPRATEDVPYTVVCSFERDQEAILTWRFNTTASWLRFDPAYATLWGTPTQSDVGSYRVGLAVADQFGGHDERSFDLTVVAVNDPPVWAGAPDAFTVTAEGMALDLGPYLTDPDDAVGELALRCDDGRCRFEGTVLVLGFSRGNTETVLHLEAVDPGGLAARHDLRVIVAFPPEPGPTMTVHHRTWTALAGMAAVASVGAVAYVMRDRKDAWDRA